MVQHGLSKSERGLTAAGKQSLVLWEQLSPVQEPELPSTGSGTGVERGQSQEPMAGSLCLDRGCGERSNEN